jgi:cathepsin A (carboxypeptidase C)
MFKRSILLSAAVLALLGFQSFAKKDDMFLDEDYESGLVPLSNGDDLFYWLFKSKTTPSTDPVVMWLTGGPGCASEVALFYENGPYTINKDMSLNPNAQAWNKFSNLLYIDQPVGSGFSKCSSIFHYDTTEDQIAETMKTFLDGFIAANPEYKGRDFYITGESYAGHYIPAIGYYLSHNVTDLPLNFKGVAIGNGWVDPIVQYPQYAEFAYENNLIGSSQYLLLKAGFATCQKTIETGSWFYALEMCQLLMSSILGNPLAPAFNVYDIRKKCDVPPLCYDMSNAETFLNLPEVQAKLGVSGRKWTECSQEVHTFLLGDWINNLAQKVAGLIEGGYEVLVYSGDKDFVCNWRGGEAWTNAVEWSGKADFNAAPYKEWTVNGQPAGQLKEFKNFKFLRVYNAGHMVPMDQPENALAMLQQFI